MLISNLQDTKNKNNILRNEFELKCRINNIKRKILEMILVYKHGRVIFAELLLRHMNLHLFYAYDRL